MATMKQFVERFAQHAILVKKNTPDDGFYQGVDCFNSSTAGMGIMG